MSRPCGVLKNDAAARRAWGRAYGDIPKSVFALVAWHLANMASDRAGEPGAAELMVVSEIKALAEGGHMDKKQALAAAKAIAKEG